MTNIRECIIDSKIDHYRYTETNVRLKDGDLFDLPEGMEFKQDSKRIFNSTTHLPEDKAVIRLVPSKEEKEPVKESQEELFRQIVEVFNKEHLKYGRPDYNVLKSKFAIQRKSK